jgi:hypothetical protein
MHTFADPANSLNPTMVHLSGLQSWFDVQVIESLGYEDPYRASSQAVLYFQKYRKLAMRCCGALLRKVAPANIGYRPGRLASAPTSLR